MTIQEEVDEEGYQTEEVNIKTDLEGLFLEYLGSQARSGGRGDGEFMKTDFTE